MLYASSTEILTPKTYNSKPQKPCLGAARWQKNTSGKVPECLKKLFVITVAIY